MKLGIERQIMRALKSGHLRPQRVTKFDEVIQ
jgi:hypothetical protein